MMRARIHSLRWSDDFCLDKKYNLSTLWDPDFLGPYRPLDSKVGASVEAGGEGVQLNHLQVHWHVLNHPNVRWRATAYAVLLAIQLQLEYGGDVT